VRQAGESAVTTAARYPGRLILLHWLLAVLLLGMIVLGLMMGALARGNALKSLMLNLHLMTGLLVLFLSGVRAYYRQNSRLPAMPARYSIWRARLAQTVHRLFYGLMFGLPLLGLSVWAIDPFVGGPALFGEGVAISNAAARLHTAHYLGAWLILVALLLHIVGAMGTDDQGRRILRRMLP